MKVLKSLSKFRFYCYLLILLAFSVVLCFNWEITSLHPPLNKITFFSSVLNNEFIMGTIQYVSKHWKDLKERIRSFSKSNSCHLNGIDLTLFYILYIWLINLTFTSNYPLTLKLPSISFSVIISIKLMHLVVIWHILVLLALMIFFNLAHVKVLDHLTIHLIIRYSMSDCLPYCLNLLILMNLTNHWKFLPFIYLIPNFLFIISQLHSFIMF